MRIRISVLQTSVRDGAFFENIACADALLQRQEASAHVLLLPELWTGMPVRGEERAAHEASEAALGAVSRFCDERGVFAVAGTLPWQTARGLANRSWIVDDVGCATAFYDKTHLMSCGGEDKLFRAGDAPLLFPVGEATCSVLTGYEVLFPEFVRCLALAGAQVLFVASRPCAASGSAAATALRAAAAANQVYVVACCSVGIASEGAAGGHSAVISPDGGIVAALGEEEGALSCTLDMREVARCRKALPLAADRRPDLYAMLV